MKQSFFGAIASSRRRVDGVPSVNARSWRIRLLGQVQGSDNIWQLGIVRMFDATGVEHFVNGTAIAGSEFSGSFPVTNLQDENSATRWVSSQSDLPNAWVGVDAGVGNTIPEIVHVEIVSTTQSHNWFRTGNQFVIEYSDDNILWTESWRTMDYTGIFLSDQTLRFFKQSFRSNDVDCYFHRIFCTAQAAGGSFVSINEIDFRSAVDQSNKANGNLTGTTVHQGNRLPTQAEDNVSTTEWVSATSGSLPVSLVKSANVPFTLQDVQLTARGDDSPTQAPSDFLIQKSNGEVWETILEVAGELGWALNETRTFDPNAPLREVSAINRYIVTRAAAGSAPANIFYAGNRLTDLDNTSLGNYFVRDIVPPELREGMGFSSFASAVARRLFDTPIVGELWVQQNWYIRDNDRRYYVNFYDETNQATPAMRISPVADGTRCFVEVHNGSAWVEVGTRFNLEDFTLYKIDIQLIPGENNDGTIRIYANDALVFEVTNTTTVTPGYSGCDRIDFGDATTGNSGDGLDFSGIIVADGDTRDLSLWQMAPTTVVAGGDWTGTPADVVNKNTLDDTTVISTLTAGSSQEFNEEYRANFFVTTDVIVAEVLSVRTLNTQTAAFDMFYDIGGTEYLLGRSNVLGSPEITQYITEVDPSTGLAWQVPSPPDEIFVTNNSFETGDLTGWTASAGATVVVETAADAPDGTHIMRFEQGVSTLETISQDITTGFSIGDPLRLRAFSKTTSTFSGENDEATMILECLDGSGTVLASATETFIPRVEFGSNTWGERELPAVAIPVGTVTIRITLGAQRTSGGGAGARIGFDGVRITRADPASLTFGIRSVA